MLAAFATKRQTATDNAGAPANGACGAGNDRPQASPEVSNIAESMASRADFPAQTTNWKAG